MNMNLKMIIPLCNVGEDDFGYRLNNIKEKIKAYPKSMEIVFVEQIVNENYETFKSRIELNDSCSFITVTYPGLFNKSWLQNVGFCHSTPTDHIILSESDCIPEKPETYFTELNHSYKPDCFFGWDRILYLDKDEKTVVRDDVPRKGMAEGGFVIIKSQCFKMAGMANEFMQELGAMDNELIRRCECLSESKSLPKFPKTIYHKYHPTNFMKTGDWKNRPTRKMNTQIYNKTCKNLKKAIEYLSTKQQGLMTSPLCARINPINYLNDNYHVNKYLDNK